MNEADIEQISSKNLNLQYLPIFVYDHYIRNTLQQHVYFTCYNININNI